MTDDNFFVRQGWQCPICKRVYSPDTSMCFYCGDERGYNFKLESGYFTKEENEGYKKILDEQYKDTGINIGDLC